MRFTLFRSLEIIERTPAVLRPMLSGLSEERLTQREEENKWSVKEVLAHLIVCEKINWLPRMKIIMSENADKTFEPMDMNAHYELAKSESPENLLNEFETRRANSIAVLKAFNLTENDFSKTGFHPKISEVSLQQLIAAWVTHDLSHLSQISRILAKQYKNEVGAFTAYLTILK